MLIFYLTLLCEELFLPYIYAQTTKNQYLPVKPAAQREECRWSWLPQGQCLPGTGSAGCGLVVQLEGLQQCWRFQVHVELSKQGSHVMALMVLDDPTGRAASLSHSRFLLDLRYSTAHRSAVRSPSLQSKDIITDQSFYKL